MKILVASDTHGRWGALINAINQHPDARVVIHTGDGFGDLERIRGSFPKHVLTGVVGNCDICFDPNALIWNTVSIDGVKIFFTHGHTFNVKAGEEQVVSAAKQQGAQICLYGHSHIPSNGILSGIHVMNPGSLALPRRGVPTYGIIEISGGKISMRIEEYNG